MLNILKKNYTYRIFIDDNYMGELKNNSKNNVYLMPIDELISKKKRFCSTVLVEEMFYKLLLDQTKKFEINIVSDEDENMKSLNLNTFN